MEAPQSLHKYAYVHGDPVSGKDPTGMFLAGSLASASIMLSMNAMTLTQGFVIGLTLNTVGRAGIELRNTGLILVANGNLDMGLVLYELGGELFGLAANTIEVANQGLELFSIGIAVVGITRSLKGAVANGGLDKIARSVRSMRTAPQAIVSAVANLGRRNGKVLSQGGLETYQHLAEAITRNANGERVFVRVRKVAVADLPPGAGAVYSVDPNVRATTGTHYGVIKVKQDATVYEMYHEWQHLKHHMEVGDQFTTLNKAQREYVVYTRMRNSPIWNQLSAEEQRDAYRQAHRIFDDNSVGPDRPPGFNEVPGI